MLNVEFHSDSSKALRSCLQNYNNVTASKLKWHDVVVHKNVFRDYVKYMTMQRCHIAQWHDGLKRSGNAEMPFRATSYRTTHVENNAVQLLASCLLLFADGLCVSYQRKWE